MRPRVDLDLIRQSLRVLNDSTYFEHRLHEFTSRLISSIDHVLSNPGRYDAAVERTFADYMRLVQSYLSGSTTNEVPYEVVYCLTDALRRWDTRSAVIVTHLTEGQNFHFAPADPWSFIKGALPGYDSSGFDLLLVMIGVPRLYAHKPVFCIPLYHELGHFVDVANRITDVSLLSNPRRLSANAHNEALHRREYFADLFAACFVGRSSVAALEAIAPTAPASPTHPATADRIAVVDAFFAGNSNSIVDMFQSAIAARSLPSLKPIFSRVAVADFDDLRTFRAKTAEEIHGLFDGAWRYLFSTIDAKRNPWSLGTLSDGDVESITNDLTEKSIRNFALEASWNAAASRP